jgi:hypothetical protein
MLSRSLALLFIPILPFIPLIAPFGSAHAANAVIAGVIASVLAVFSLVDNRARVAVAVVGGWVALSPFIFDATLLEEVITVSWGVSTFVLMIGPFSERPSVTFVATLPVKPARETEREQLPLAA